MKYDYYYSNEADQFEFYRIPKAFFRDPVLSGMEAETKLLYGLMLDRMGLSRKNGWIDEMQRVFIIYKNEQVQQDLNCSVQKAVRFLKQLEEYGLIIRIKRGQGKAALIYVMNYVRAFPEAGPEPDQDETGTTRLSELESLNEEDSTEESARLSKMESLGLPERNRSNNNINNNNWSESIYPSESTPPCAHTGDEMDTCDVAHVKARLSSISQKKGICAEDWEHVIKEQINYGLLKSVKSYDNRVDEIVMIMMDVMTSTKEMIRLGGVDKPISVVQSRFRIINSQHVLYVLESMNQIKQHVRNIYAYLLTALYRAPETISCYYDAQCCADMELQNEQWGT